MILKLSDDDRDAFETGMPELPDFSGRRDFDSLLLSARNFASRTNLSFSSQLNDFRDHGDERGFVYLTGFPTVGHLPPTPTLGNNSDVPLLVAFCLTVIAAILGEPVGYAQESEGQILQSVFPTQINASLISSQSSKVRLAWHTELAFHPYCQDWILLAGLRCDRNGEAKTFILPFRKILRKVEQSVLEELRKQNFLNGVDPSFGLDKEVVGPRIAVLSMDEGRPRVRYDLDLGRPLTAGAARALRRISELSDRSETSVLIEPGGILIIDNREAAHARSPFVAAFDGGDRWLIRMGVRLVIPKRQTKSGEVGRIIDVDLSSVSEIPA